MKQFSPSLCVWWHWLVGFLIVVLLIGIGVFLSLFFGGMNPPVQPAEDGMMIPHPHETSTVVACPTEVQVIPSSPMPTEGGTPPPTPTVQPTPSPTFSRERPSPPERDWDEIKRGKEEEAE